MTALTDAFSRFTGQHEPRREVISGWMADPEGYGDPIVRDETTGDPTGYYYCMIDRGDGTNSGDFIKVWGGGIRPVAGWPVLIGTTRERPWELSILSIDKEAMGGGIDKYAQQVEPHHETHEWGDPSGSDDVVYSRFLQLYDFSVWPVPGTRAVTVADGVFDPSGTKGEFPYTTVSLEAYAPSGTGTSRWVVVCLDPSGVVQTYACPSGTNLTIADICQVPYADWWELAAVKLWQNDSSINMTPGAEEVIDLRFARLGWPQHGGLGSGTNWENVYVVAKSGGDYATLQAAELAAPCCNHQILVMPGDYYENLTINTTYLGFEGIGNRYRDFHVKVLGADDTGPIVTMAVDCALIDLNVERELTGGSGAFYYVDAAYSGKYPKITDCRIIADAGSTGRQVIGLKASGSGIMPAIINRTYIKVEAGAGSSLAVEVTGGTVLLENCEIEGDIEATAATTLVLRNCFITGDVTGVAGSDLYLDLSTYVSGTTTGWDSTTYRPTAGGGASTFDALTDTPANKTGSSLQHVRVNVGETALEYSNEVPDHDHTGDSGDGGQLDHGAALTGLTDDDHTQYLLNLDNVLVVNPAGATRTGQYYATIAAALAAASSGDTIIVTPGTYVEDITAVSGVTLWGFSRYNTALDGTLTISGTITGFTACDIQIGTGNDNGPLVHSSSGTNYLYRCYVYGYSGSPGPVGVNLSAGVLYILDSFVIAGGGIAPYGILSSGGTLWFTQGWTNTINNTGASVTVTGGNYGAATGTIGQTLWAYSALDAIKTVDGTGSGLDADLLDGLETSNDPGAAAAALVTDASGHLAIEHLGVGAIATAVSSLYTYMNETGFYAAQFIQGHATGYGVLVDSEGAGAALRVDAGTLTQALEVTQNGVGVGVTPSASYKFYVYDNTAAQYSTYIRQVSATGYGLHVDSEGTLAALRVDAGSVADMLRVDQVGVAVGGVAGSASYRLYSYRNTSSAYCIGAYNDQGTAGHVLYLKTDGSGGGSYALEIDTAAFTPLLRVTGNQVGIGGAPDHLFHVNSTALSTGGHLGEAFAGTWTTAGYAHFSHWNFYNSAGGYGFMQSSVGNVYASAPTGYSGYLRVNNVSTAWWNSARFQVELDLYVAVDARIGQGLIVGTIGSDPYNDDLSVQGGITVGYHADAAAGNIYYTGDLYSRKASTNRVVYGVHPLTTPLTSTSWDGDAKNQTTAQTLDLNSVFSAPVDIQAVLLSLDAVSATADNRIAFTPVNSTSYGPLQSRCQVANRYYPAYGLIPTNGRYIYWWTQGTGGMSAVYLQIWGYCI